MNADKEKTLAKQTIADCKILYCDASLPMTKTCMCWGWECGEGWWHVLHRLSCELEALNLLVYDKWKVRIQADQVKEKFGTLCFYYSVICDNYTEAGLEARKVIDAFEDKKDSGYFGLKYVVDKKGWTEDVVDEDGKKHSVWHAPESHIEVTAHKDEYDKMLAEADAARNALSEKGYYDMTPQQKIMLEFLEAEADKRISQAEKDCYSTCEHCGSQIGTDWSPRCQTTGWISYICDKCAEKTKNIYYKNGEKWQGKKRLMTREEVKAEHEEFERKWEEKCEAEKDSGADAFEDEDKKDEES